MIRNRNLLVENGSTDLYKRLRLDACDILDFALEAVQPERAVKNALRLEDNKLIFKEGIIDLTKINKTIVLGGGKAGGLMAKAVESILGDRVTSGCVNVLEGTENEVRLANIRLNGASHPVPSDSGINGVQEMLSITSNLNENDLVLALISGGGSALMPLPANGITLNDLQSVTETLLRAGATINELNAVRKHLSAIKGGQLARHLSPATVLSLILSDVIGDPLDTIASGPTVPDNSTYTDAIYVFKKYNLLDEIPESIKDRLNNGAKGNTPETPKKNDPIFQRVFNLLIANNSNAAKAARDMAENFGYNSMILSTYIEGEARNVGNILPGIAKELFYKNSPLAKPSAIILGGETTVTVVGEGKGGRNQEVALGAIRGLNSLSSLIATLGTDGIDGPTDAAGAIIDGDTLKKAEKNGLVLEKYLNQNDSYTFFKQIQDNIITGPTGTNVNDLTLILVM